MSNNIVVRASRDGDQFHYLWAARRSLDLLNPESELVAISIEGSSPNEKQDAEPIEAGESVIDIAEYYGDEELEKATLVCYLQLKHSTLRSNEEWKPSGLEGTIRGFSKRYTELLEQFSFEFLRDKIEFWFVTNRPVDVILIEAIEDSASQAIPRHPLVHTKLEKFTSLDGENLSRFCQAIRFEDRQDNYWEQRNILSEEISGYLPDRDRDAPGNLKELVTRKALSEHASTPVIKKMDVLRVLQVDPSDLLPRRCLIDLIEDAIPRHQEQVLIEAICEAEGKPVVINADSGVGKSIFSTRIGLGLPDGSVNILYDCFGNGQYRSVTGYRHQHRIALTQISNELSALGLCHPMIPTSSADASSFMKAFVHRLRQSISVLKARNDGALLCITIDAADNAQMAAEEINEPRSFVRDLLRENLPESVRLVALCRPHREVLLDPPAQSLSLVLNNFTHQETGVNLRQHFPSATDEDIDEFHRLSSENPRVQALALSRGSELPAVLRKLGPNPTSVENTIAALLENSIVKLKDEASDIERSQIDLICAGLAILRPLVPISVLAEISGVQHAAVRSFVIDIGRPLLVTGEFLQFYDEPAETWFRERFRPDTESVKRFVSRLIPLTSNSAYVASALPELMLDAGQFEELVGLALESKGLPNTSPVERRDIELQRLQFAVKASLRTERYMDAAKLALKAGGESAGDDRQRSLLQENTDLASIFLESSSVQELVSRRIFGSGWVGSHNVYEAAILSGHSELQGDARSRLRLAEQWLQNWSKLSKKERENEEISDEDIAALAMASLGVHGVDACAKDLRRWRPRDISYRIGRIVAKRLLDQGRYSDLDELALSAKNDLPLILAINQEAKNLHHHLPKKAVKHGFKLISSPRLSTDKWNSTSENLLFTVTTLLQAAYHYDICDGESGKLILERYLPESPPYDFESSHGSNPVRSEYMRSRVLHAAFSGETLEITDFASSKLRKELEDDNDHSASQELRRFKARVGAMLPWYKLWAEVILRKVKNEELKQNIGDIVVNTAKAEGQLYGESSDTPDSIASVWMDILIEADALNEDSIQKCIDWSKSPKRRLFTPTLNRFSRLCSRTDNLQSFAYYFAQEAFELAQSERSDAAHTIEYYIDIARSLLALDKIEAQSYFDRAVEVASKIGDENIVRWDALINLADTSASANNSSPEIAYKFSRCAELCYEYVYRDKHFDWRGTIKALAGLDAASSLSVLSRWHDRGFGYRGRLLARTLESLVESGKLSPLDALPFIGFDAEWHHKTLLEKTLLHCKTEAEKVTAILLVYRYRLLASADVRASKWLQDIAATEGVEIPASGEGISSEEVAEAETFGNSEAQNPVLPLEYAEKLFSGLDLSIAEDILIAYQRHQDKDSAYNDEIFFRSMFEHIPVGDQARSVAVFGNVGDFDLYVLRNYLIAFPKVWSVRQSIKNALRDTLKNFYYRCSSNPMLDNQYYEVVPLSLAFELSDITKEDLVDVVLVGISESAELPGPEQLFTLVSLLSHKMTADEAQQALSFGLKLFDSILEDSDGDGPWVKELAPPQSVNDALAGYLWASLASPVTSTRWEAAHVVVAACELGRSGLVDSLINHSINDITAPYADNRFQFYSHHARLWLFIALARYAIADGTALLPHLNYLMSLSTKDQAHVLLRLFAARTVLAMHKNELIELSTEDIERISSVNIQGSAVLEQDLPKTVLQSAQGETNSYLFGIDFGPYWLASLGRCFGMSQNQIGSFTLDTLKEEFGYASPRHRDVVDERNKCNIYEYQETRHSHGSLPRIDDLEFYLSYHSMMIAAGRLLKTKPLKDLLEGRDEEGFAIWIEGHDIARSDGRWLADRRDHRPKNCLEISNEEALPSWLGTISAADFDQALYPETGFLTVSGYWTELQRGHKAVSLAVSSALVCTERSSSLLRALQTTGNSHDFKIPDFDDSLQIDSGPYKLRGWLCESGEVHGLDRMDPWAADVRYPAAAPAKFVMEEMGLTTDADQRIWGNSKHTVALRSEVWGSPASRNDEEVPSGQRLNASKQFLTDFLKEVDMDLILEVEINKRNRYGSYITKSDDELEDIPHSSKIFVLKSDGSINEF